MVASYANSNDGITPAQARMMSPSQTAPHDAHLRLLGTVILGPTEYTQSQQNGMSSSLTPRRKKTTADKMQELYKKL